MNQIRENVLRMFRVYSPFRPKIVATVWAHDDKEAVATAKKEKRALAQYSNVRAFIA